MKEYIEPGIEQTMIGRTLPSGRGNTAAADSRGGAERSLLRSAVAAAVFAVALAAPAAPLHAGVYFNDDFESGNINNFGCAGNCPTVSNAVSSSGRFAMRALLTPDMTNSYRTEATPQNSVGSFDFHKDYWISFKMMLPADFQEDSGGEFLFQVHTQPSDWASCAPINNNEPLTIQTLSGQIGVGINKGGGWIEYSRWVAPYKRGVWMQWVFHVRFSSGSDGLVEAWKDGTKLFSDSGPNSDPLDTCGKAMANPYLKIGVYHWAWKNGGTSESTKREVFYDDIRLGDSTSSLAEIAPSVGGNTPTPPSVPTGLVLQKVVVNP